ncbi:MAG: hypothetical protein OEY45_09680 [Gammaproteobacteria bacterium]|nr:hypothetical protein [Gammaproteobacteria bacterium]
MQWKKNNAMYFLLNTMSPSRLLLLLLAAACSYPAPAQAANFRITNSPVPAVMLSIGSGPHVAEVTFRINSAELGNGVPIRARPDVRIAVANRATPNNSRVAVLTVDSSIPLRNGAHTTPFTTISWISRNGIIPSGRYDGSTSQFQFSFSNSQEISDRHRFYYDNAEVLEAGAYTGTVTYTLSMP